MQKKWNQSQKKIGLKKAYFWGHPAEDKMHGPFYKKLIFWQNISSLKKSDISIRNELR